MKKLYLGVLFLIMSCGVAFGGTVSFDQLSVSDDLSAVKYNSDLNRIYQKVNNNVQADNIANDTLLITDFADESDPSIRTKEGAACQFVYTGLLPASGASLTQNTSAGTAYPMGFRIVKSSATSKTYTASKWTWVDIDQNGDFQYSEVSIGGATPSVATNSIRLALVSSDATTVNTVTDLRTTSCSSGPFSIISDAAGEADLGDILTYGNGGWKSGFNLVSADSTTFTVQPGAARINGEFRALTANLTVNSAVTAAPTSGTSGIDAGPLAANTNYYVWGVADQGGVTPLTVIMSTSASAPAGAINYRRLGEIKTEPGLASLVSSDAVSVSYSGKLRQRKKFQTGSTLTGTTVMPNDNTVPQNGDGDQYLTISFTPTSATNRLRISGIVNGASSAEVFWLAALFRDSYPGAFAVVSSTGAAATMSSVAFSYDMIAGTTSSTTFNVRCGALSGTFTFNGAGGAGLFGGSAISSITVEEYEP